MIQYKGVSKIFGSGPTAVAAVNNVTLDIEGGQLVTFLGPSGCGKTTLLRLTNRLLPLTGGQIIIEDRDIMSWDEVRLRQSMGYAIQEIGLFPNKTIYGNIAVVPRLLKWDEKRIRKRVEELLIMLRLEPEKFLDRYPAELSGGQQQRIGVARCLAADPDLMLMDEPFGAIDPINREEIQDEFLKIQSRLKKSIAFVTHDIYEAIKMGDKIAIFKDGKLIQYDTPEGILMRPVNGYIEDFVGSDRALKVLGLLKAGDSMNREPCNTANHSMNTVEALKFMKDRNLSSLMVMDHDKPVGHVTIEKLRLRQTTLKTIADPYPFYIRVHDNLRDVLSNMLLHDIKELPVVDDNGNLAGIIGFENIHRHIIHIYSDNPE